MEIILRSRSKPIKKKIERDHYWYDHHSGQMLHGLGGEMRFRYEDGRNVPYLVDHEDWVTGNDYEEIIDWVRRNSALVDIVGQAKDHYIVVDVDPIIADEIKDNLTAHGILHDDY